MEKTIDSVKSVQWTTVFGLPLKCFELVIAGVVTRNVAYSSQIFTLTGAEVGFVEKPRKKNKITEVHGQRQFDVEP